MASTATTAALGGSSLNLAYILSRTPESRARSNSAPIVFLVGSDPSERELLEPLIVHQGWQLETFESPREFLARPRPLVPNCLILALSFPDPNGIELQKQIVRERPETRIIVASSRVDTPTIVRVMKAGALDFLVKPFNEDVLVTAIRQCLEQSSFALDREMKLRSLRRCYMSLTCREQQVMALVVSGLLNKQVGAELGVSERTVKAHRGQVMQKMKANSLADLVRMAARLGPMRQAISALTVDRAGSSTSHSYNSSFPVSAVA